jgi:hypothetical protein
MRHSDDMAKPTTFNPFTKKIDFIGDEEADVREGVNKWELYYGGIKIAEIDSNGNLKIKGNISTERDELMDNIGILPKWGFAYTSANLDVYWGTRRVAQFDSDGNLKILGNVLSEESMTESLNCFNVFIDNVLQAQFDGVNGHLNLRGNLSTNETF